MRSPATAIDVLRAYLLRADVLREGTKARLAEEDRVETRRARSVTRVAEIARAVEVSADKNRLDIKVHGFLDAAQATAMLLELQLALPRLRPGFDVVFDVSRVGSLTSSAMPLLRRAASALVEAGIRRMVRVGLSPAAAALTGAVEGAYPARAVASTSEAAHLLEHGTSSPLSLRLGPPLLCGGGRREKSRSRLRMRPKHALWR